MYRIYIVTNLTNSKHYIGLTNHSMQHRWKEHLNSANSCADDYVFHKAIRKYGADNFEIRLLEDNLSKEQAQAQERYYISLYDTYYSSGHGYNMTYGGECNDHKKGELSYCAKITNVQAAKIRSLLRDYSLTYFDIARQLGLETSENIRALITRINSGESYHDDSEKYPIRADGRSVEGPRRKGEKNPSAKLNTTQVLNIIRELEEGKISQAAIGAKYHVTYNTINLINRCKTWTNLHSYSRNIRKEYEQKGVK